MVDTVEEKVEHEEKGRVGKHVVDVEQETVEGVLEDCPDDIAAEESDGGASDSLGEVQLPDSTAQGEGGLLRDGTGKEGKGDGQPDERHNPPWCKRKDLEPGLGEELGRVGEVSRLVDLLQVKRLGKVGVPHLHQQRAI